jgi:hypothetical protein
MRILGTGSRDYDDRARVREGLQEAYRWALATKPGVDPDVTVVEGGNRGRRGHRGADRLIREEAHALGWPVITVEAQWRKFGAAAGPIRNQVMVDMVPRADVCVAFPLADSVGTRDCMARAEATGIPVQDWSGVEPRF